MTDDFPSRFGGLKLYGGLPVPFTVHWADGVPDFRVNDLDAMSHCLAHRLCVVCGQPLGYWLTFIGGPQSFEHRAFLDGPMHDECARWSAAHCPFLVGRLDQLSDPEKRPPRVAAGADATTYPGALPERPRMGFYVTRSYSVVNEKGSLVIHPAPAKRIEWFDDASALDPTAAGDRTEAEQEWVANHRLARHPTAAGEGR